MARYIDADALISVLEDMRERHRKNLFFVSANAYDGAARIVKAMKTIEARPVVRGEWISLTHCSNAGVYCSVCRKKVYKEDYAWANRKNKLRSDYCPNCGAELRGEEDATD